MKNEWESSVLNCFDGDNHCPTCKFLAGDRSSETLLDVIKNLDHMLATEEALVREMTDRFTLVREMTNGLTAPWKYGTGMARGVDEE